MECRQRLKPCFTRKAPNQCGEPILDVYGGLGLAVCVLGFEPGKRLVYAVSCGGS
jgi:hypothetical protein